MTDLCLTLAEASCSALEQKISHYTGQVRYIEVRLDYLSQPQVPAIPSDARTEFIATCRPPREGGHYQGDEVTRLQLLHKAAESGFSWIDVEHDVQEDLRFPPSTRVVRSYHRFDEFAEDFQARFQNLQQAGGHTAKLATAVTKTEELVSLLQWMECLTESGPFVVLGMGDLGQPSRILGAFLGNLWTYVAEAEDEPVAPGQFTLQQAQLLYRLDNWNSTPQIYGVIGNPVAHSLSPAIHNRLFQHHELEKLYLPLPLDDVDAWLDYVKKSRLPFQGFSVTLPFKTDVLKFVQEEHSAVGALNTLARRGASWEGLNTDYQGFLLALKARLSLQGKRAVVLGNGGVAHTVVKALQDEGAQVTVVGRNADRVSSFVECHACETALFSDLPMPADICVNTTPVGQYPEIENSPLREDQLDFELVYDLIYHPERTKLLEMAEQRGVQTISGMEMFVEQAALQFIAWTGISPDRSLMKEIVRRAMEQES